MIISNLTEGEREVLAELLVADQSWGMMGRIALRLGKRKCWVCYVMKRLCDSGHAVKIRRGIYRPNLEE